MIGSLSFDFFGTPVRGLFTYEDCLRDVQRYFSAFTKRWSVTPLVTIACDRQQMDRELFRSRPEHCEGTPLEGVYYATPEAPALVCWTSASPPFPPYTTDALKGRLTALHGACVRYEDMTLLIVGDRRSGKTTTAWTLCERGAQFRGDETALLLTGTTISMSLPHAWNIQTGGGRKYVVDVADTDFPVDMAPRPLDAILVLGDEEVVTPRRLTPAAALVTMPRHLRYAGSSLVNTYATMSKLCLEVPTFQAGMTRYSDRVAACDAIVDAAREVVAERS